MNGGQVDWRFLTIPDDQPGFSTAWLRPRSLKRLADRREKEYQDDVMVKFARDLGVADAFSTGQSNSDTDEEKETCSVEHPQHLAVSPRDHPDAPLLPQAPPSYPQVRRIVKHPHVCPINHRLRAFGGELKPH